PAAGGQVQNQSRSAVPTQAAASDPGALRRSGKAGGHTSSRVRGSFRYLTAPALSCSVETLASGGCQAPDASSIRGLTAPARQVQEGEDTSSNQYGFLLGVSATVRMQPRKTHCGVHAVRFRHSWPHSLGGCRNHPQEKPLA